MEEVEYFFDTYAVIEIIKKNPNYEPYVDNDVTLVVFNMAEVYYSVLNTFDEKTAEEIYEKYKSAIVEIPEEVLKESMKFRKTHKKRNLSYADAIGYTYALKNGMKFLTGDKEFENLPNVEFVK